MGELAKPIKSPPRLCRSCSLAVGRSRRSRVSGDHLNLRMQGTPVTTIITAAKLDNDGASAEIFLDGTVPLVELEKVDGHWRVTKWFPMHHYVPLARVTATARQRLLNELRSGSYKDVVELETAHATFTRDALQQVLKSKEANIQPDPSRRR